MSNSSRRKGFSFLSFFLGILIGVILVLGAIGGAVAFVLMNDIDTVLNTVGVDNSKDENGNNKIINTDVENGGVKTLFDLVTAVGGIAGNAGEASVGDIERLLPVASGLVDQALEAVSDFIELDRDDFTAVKFAELGEYVSDVILDLKPAEFLDKFGFNLSGNNLIEVMLLGVEADYVEVGGVNYPVRVQKGEEDVYFYLNSNGAAYIVESNENGYTATVNVYSGYNSETAELTGNYYYENADTSGEKIMENPITLRTFTEGDNSLEPLNKIKVSDMLSGGGDITEKVFGEITVGQLVKGDVDFDEVIKELEIADLMDIDPESAIMAYLGYGLVDLNAVSGETYAYTGVYKSLEAGAEDINCFIETDGIHITHVYYMDGGVSRDISGTSVADVSKRIDGVMNDIKIGQLMNISDENKLLQKFKNSTVKSLPGDIEKLSLNELYAEEIYVIKNDDGTVAKAAELRTAVDYVSNADEEEEFNSDYLYYENVNGVWKLVEGGGKLTDEQFANRGNKVYKTYGGANSLWKIVLYATAADGSSEEKAYTVNSVGDMINNIKININNASLYDLKKAGIISVSGEALKKHFPGDTKEVGELPLAEILRRFLESDLLVD